MEKIGYLGIDCGSVSIKLAVIDDNKNVVKTSYLKNRGLIETLQQGIKEIYSEYEIIGCGTTGSGRDFASYLVGADIVKTEILAHTIATLNFYPNVKTILDIGGEDCKIMSVKNGILENFVMNAICGAGTGSVVESVAGRMGIDINDVGDIALSFEEKIDFPSKCGVFTQSAVVSRLNSGCRKSDILMGVIKALVNNYLMLGRGIKLEPPYVYQGATSKNKAIVFVLQEYLKSDVIIPKYAAEMGAIGMALIAKKEYCGKSNFKGYFLSAKNYYTKNFNANGCDNNCEISLIYDDDKYIGAIGNKCEKCVPKIR